MLFRRIGKNISDQNWLAVSLDFVIVVVGVFIGIQVANWNEERQLRQTERQFLAQLHDDILGVDEIIGSRLGRHNGVVSHFISAMDKISAGQAQLINDQECVAMTGSYISTTSAPRLNSIEELRASSGLNILSDAELKRNISSLIAAIDFIDDLVFKRGQFVFMPSNEFPDIIMVEHYIDENNEVRLNTFCNTEKIPSNQRFINAMMTNLDYQDTLTNRVKLTINAYYAIHKRLDELLGVKH